MLNLIARGDVRVLPNPSSSHAGLATHATEILPAPAAGGHGERYPFLDPRLRDLLVRCLAVDRADRPGLPEMLRVARAAVENDNRPDDDRETDEALAGVLRLFVYDADGEPAVTVDHAPAPLPPRAPTPVPAPRSPPWVRHSPDTGPFCVGTYEMPPIMNGVWSFP